MPPVDWAHIRTGATFQSLVGAIVQFRDHRARTFSRPGPDGGQDVLSGDGATVYQAKYHEDRDTNHAFRDARAELEKIRAYRDTGHRHNGIWRNVTNWVLVSQVRLNADDLQRWRTQFEPLFRALPGGELRADIWWDSHLENKLDHYPELVRSYFEDEIRVFLSMSEARDSIAASDVLTNLVDVPFAGRGLERQRFDAFLASNERILPIHGIGGVGKTRFAYELAVDAQLSGRVDDALWTNADSLISSTRWFSGIVPERKVLVVIDEPSDPLLVGRVLERLAGDSGRLAGWKVILTLRTPKDPVLLALRRSHQRFVAPDLALDPLPDADARAFAGTLVSTYLAARIPGPDAQQDYGNQLAAFCGRLPVWMAISVRLTLDGRPLTELHRDRLAEVYLDEVLRLAEDDELELGQRRTLLRWLALYQPVNRQNEAFREFVADQVGAATPAAIERAIESLRGRRVLRARGRLVEVFPDVIRDRIVIDWLTLAAPEGRVPSGEARELVQRLIAGGDLPHRDTVIRALGRLERIVGGANLLGPLIDRVRADAASAQNAHAQALLLEVSQNFAFARPLDFAEIVTALRTRVAAPLTVPNPFSERLYDHDSLVLDLPWQLFGAATQATEGKERRAIFAELFELVRTEAAIGKRRSLPNDGKRAAQLLARVMTDRAELLSDFTDEAEATALVWGERLANDANLSEPDEIAIRTLFEALMAVERTEHSSEAFTVTFRTFAVAPGSRAFQFGGRLRENLWGVVAGHAGTSRKRFAWKLLADAHLNLMRAAARVVLPEFLDRLEDDLKRALDLLAEGRVAAEHLIVSREVWGWHARFDKRERFRTIALQCEERFLETETGEIARLFHHDIEDYKAAERLRDERATALSQTDDVESVLRFLAAARAFIQSAPSYTHDTHLLGLLCETVGNRGSVNPVITTFVLQTLRQGVDAEYFESAAAMGIGWANAVRSGIPPELHTLVTDLLQACPDERTRTELLVRLFGWAWIATPTRVDLEFVIRGFDAILAHRPTTLFGILGTLLFVDFEAVGRLVERAWEDTPRPDWTNCFGMFVDRLATRVAREDRKLSRAELEWLVGQLARIPDLDGVQSHAFWEVAHVASDRLPVSSFADFIDQRLAALSTDDQESRVLPASEEDLLRLFDTVDPAGVTESTTGAFFRLVPHIDRRDLLGYQIPRYLVDLDPQGAVLPSMVEQRLLDASAESAKVELSRWARVGGHYAENSPGWRRIAHAACVEVERRHLSDSDRRSVYASLLFQGVRLFQGTPGQVFPEHEADVRAAEQRITDDPDPMLKPFWEWKLTVAQAELERARMRVEEDFE